MNLGPNAKEAFEAAGANLPHRSKFHNSPFPDGPLELGTLVEGIKEYYPINQGTDRVPIPDGQRYSDTKEDINASVKSSLGGDARLLARVLDRSTSGELSLKEQQSDEDVVSYNGPEDSIESDYVYRAFYSSQSLVDKIYYMKKLWSSEKAVGVERVRKGAVKDDKAKDEFVITNINNKELISRAKLSAS
ncbi:hypothetical protein K469DRAFT_691715 [Zopfia rhizophila CBS 207.26]|uniref:Uncharacterized protein n=1 Tax=Zopfia rhizophila CBS 207.26 TaxID=1314779 RepID=A0A6A6DVV8_9PEZI|nr:hypothetical protein K469DRAFT_691715 [Zopfia rhizophila CBS 207.26]